MWWYFYWDMLTCSVISLWNLTKSTHWIVVIHFPLPQFLNNKIVRNSVFWQLMAITPWKNHCQDQHQHQHQHNCPIQYILMLPCNSKFRRLFFDWCKLKVPLKLAACVKPFSDQSLCVVAEIDENNCLQRYPSLLSSQFLMMFPATLLYHPTLLLPSPY